MRRWTTVAAVILGLAAPAAAGDPLDDLRSSDPDARARGRAALAADGSEDLLLRALGDAEGPVRGAAAEALAARPERAGPRHRAALRDLLRDPAAGLAPRAAAAGALGVLRDPSALNDLRAALGDIPEEACLAIAEIGDATALEDLRRRVASLGADAPPAAGYALARLGDPAGEDLLLDRLADERAPVAASALHLLRRLTGRDLDPSVGAWKEAIRVRRLAAALGDRDWEKSEEAMKGAVARGAAAAGDLLRILRDPAAASEARAKAALALGILRREEAGPDLLEAARIGKDPFVRVYALEALGRIAWAPAAPDLARMLVNDEDLEVPKSFFDSREPFQMVQSAAARALLDMGCEGALAVPVDQLSRGGTNTLPGACVSDFRIRVYWEAMAALRAYGGPGAVDGFGFRPESGPAERAASAAKAVAWWRSHPADLVVPVRARFDDPGFVAGVNREIRILGEYKFLEMDRSRRALILLGRPAVPHVIGAVALPPSADPSGQRRIGAAVVLGAIGDRAAVPALRAALARAEIPPVRCQVLIALAALLPEGGVPEAVRLLDSANPDERSAAAEALALCPTARSSGPAARLLAAPGADPIHRIHLATALLAGRDPAGLPVLLGYLAEPDVVLRRRAWAGIDRWTEGLGPFDPESGTGVEEVQARQEAWTAAPRFREGAVPGR